MDSVRYTGGGVLKCCFVQRVDMVTSPAPFTKTPLFSGVRIHVCNPSPGQVSQEDWKFVAALGYLRPVSANQPHNIEARVSFFHQMMKNYRWRLKVYLCGDCIFSKPLDLIPSTKTEHKPRLYFNVF